MKSNFQAGNLWHLRLSLSWAPGIGLDGQEQCWDALVNWCANQNAYLGGTATRAFVLIMSDGAQLQRKLHKWLSGRPSLEAFVLTPVTISVQPASRQTPDSRDQKSTISIDDGPAVLEALAHYQQHLLEQMQWTVDLLPLLQRLGPSANERPTSVRAMH